MHKASFVFAAALIIGSPLSAQVDYGESVPVQLEESDGLDPCALAVVANVGDDSSAMVFTAPNEDADTIDYLSDGDVVWVCQVEDNYYGIVYGNDDQDCEVSSPVDVTVNYSGPCNTGWIVSDWVEIVAG